MRSFHVLWSALLAAALVACGGGGDAVIPPDSGATPPPSGDAQLATLSAIGAAYAALTLDTPTNDALAMLAAVRAMPEVSEAEITQDGVIAYQFSDGTSAILDTRRSFEHEADFPPLAGAALRPAGPGQQSQAVRVASGRKVFLYDALTEELGTQSWSTISDIGGWFTKRGYAVDARAFTSPAGLRSVQDAAVLYIDSHGSIGTTRKQGGDRFYAIATSVPVNDANRKALAAEIAAGEVGFYGVPELYAPASIFQGWRITTYMFITPTFVLNHMTFQPGALVFVNGCEFMMAGAEAAKMRAAFSARGATVQIGWSSFVSAQFAAESARYLFDRLLGTNGFGAYDASPPNRPFDLPAVFDAMKSTDRKLNIALQAPGRIKLTQSRYFLLPATLSFSVPDRSGDTLSLVPSIGNTYLDNAAGRLDIDGSFGAKPTRSYSVTLDDRDVSAQADWTPTRITVNGLASTGAGSGGRLVVTIDGAPSNPTYINGWRDVLVSLYAPYGGGPGTGAGTARVITSCKVNFRAATGTFRAVPDGPVTLASGNNDAALQDGTCQFSADGHYVGQLADVDLSVAGSPLLPWADPMVRSTLPLPLRYAYLSAQFQAASREMSVNMLHRIAAADGGGVRITTTTPDNKTGVFVAPLDQGNGATMSIDAQGGLLAGSRQSTLDYMTWSGTPGLYIEDAAAAR